MRWLRRISISPETRWTRRIERSAGWSEIAARVSDRSRKKNASSRPEPESVREQLLRMAKERGWPSSMTAKVLGIATSSLRRWMKRREQSKGREPKKMGRPEVITGWNRWLIRQCHEEHFGEWGPRVLAEWARREGIGTWSHTTIGKVIADLRPEKKKRSKPRRYEIAAPMVMWSEDGAGFKERGRKKELLLVQDERARKKVGKRLVDGPARCTDVAENLREAFDEHGAPLVLKQDNGAPLNGEEVTNLCDEYHVVLLNSPPYYPPFNGRKERNFRDVRGYVRALEHHRVGNTLEERIDLAIHDIDVDRPRPVLGGRTATEVFEQDRVPLPDRCRFKMEVETRQLELEADAGTRTEIAAARRRAVMEVLSKYELLMWKGNVSTDSQSGTGTN